MPGKEIRSAVEAALSSPQRVTAAARLLQGPTGQRSLDRLTLLASRITGARTAHVAVLTDRLVVASRVGRSVGERQSGELSGTLCALTAARGGPLVLPHADRDPQAGRFPVVRSGEVAAYLGIPLLSRNGTVVGSLCCTDPHPREWTPEQVEMLTDLAGAVIAELELAALSAELVDVSARQELVLQVGEVGSFEIDVPTRVATLDARLSAILGFGDGEFRGEAATLVERIHPDDAGRVLAAVTEAVRTCAEYELEYRVLAPGRAPRWVRNRGRALAGADGTAQRVIGAAHDTTEVRDAATTVARILETLPSGFASVGAGLEVTYLNAAAERMLRTSRDDVLGRELSKVLPTADELRLGHELDRALSTGETRDFEEHSPSLGTWFRVQVWPADDGGASVHFDDISARRRDEAERRAAVAAREQALLAAERATRHLEVLADLGARMGDTLDEAVVVELLLSALVPRIAGWAEVELTPAAVSSGEAEELVHSLGRRDQAAERTTALDLTGRDRTLLGTLRVQLSDTAAGERADADHLLVNLVDRAASAIDNARLFSAQRHMSEALQRSMLTRLPATPDLEIAARYRPTADHAQVGGDWYDAFVQPEGGTVVVIGDVVGHDRHAAAAMGQLRNLLRGFAFDQAIAPSTVLHKVDRAIPALEVDCLATGVVAHIESCSFGQYRLRWASAGHPPPVVLRTDGRVETLDREPNLLLGVDPETSRADHEATLRPGDTLLLYTDGLVERRGRSFTEALDDLAAALRGRAGDGCLEELCEHLLARLVPDRPDDDVALIAVRPR